MKNVLRLLKKSFVGIPVAIFLYEMFNLTLSIIMKQYVKIDGFNLQRLIYDYIEYGIQKLQEFWVSLSMPSSFQELGYKEEDLEYLINHVDYTTEGTVGNYVKLNSNDVKNIYQS